MAITSCISERLIHRQVGAGVRRTMCIGEWQQGDYQKVITPVCTGEEVVEQLSHLYISMFMLSDLSL